MGRRPPDESPPPNGPDDLQPNFYDFFGFGQTAGPNGQPENNEQEHAQQKPQPILEGWDPWPIQQINVLANANDVANVGMANAAPVVDGLEDIKSTVNLCNIS